MFISSLHIIQRIANKARFEFYAGIYTATNQTTLLQVLANRKTSSNSLTTRIPEAQPTKAGGEVDPYSPDFAPMNIFENQVIPTGIHNLSKIFRPNLATIRVLSLGMKFIPKSDTLKWKNMFSNFENFRQRMDNKMFFFVENAPGTFVWIFFFR